MAADGFIIVYDDEQGLTIPFGWDSDCDGAVECNSGVVALFKTRGEARQAIRISSRYAALCEAQGKITNADFSGAALKNVKILPLKAPEVPRGR